MLQVHYRPEKDGVEGVQLEVRLESVSHFYEMGFAFLHEAYRPVLKKFIVGIEDLKKYVRNKAEFVENGLRDRLTLTYLLFPEPAHEFHLLGLDVFQLLDDHLEVVCRPVEEILVYKRFRDLFPVLEMTFLPVRHFGPERNEPLVEILPRRKKAVCLIR